MKKSESADLLDILVKLTESQQRMNKALVSDMETLRNSVIKMERYLKLVEARREAELREKEENA